MSTQVQIKQVVTVTADPIKGISATTEGGVSMAVNGPVSVGDVAITDAAGNRSILSAADYQAALVGV